jgi:hypothetical protein
MGTPFNDQWVLERAQRPDPASGALAAPNGAGAERFPHELRMRSLWTSARGARPRRERRVKWIDRDT